MGSVKNLPKKNAHVCLKRNKANHETFVSVSSIVNSCSFLSLCIYSYSAVARRFCFFGISYNQYQKINQMKPVAPVSIKAHRQPIDSAITGTVSGARIAPTLVPELKIPVANALSF